MEPVSALIAAVVGIVLGAGAGVFAGRRIEARQAERTRGTAQAEARGILEAAEREASTLKRSAELNARPWNGSRCEGPSSTMRRISSRAGASWA